MHMLYPWRDLRVRVRNAAGSVELLEIPDDVSLGIVGEDERLARRDPLADWSPPRREVVCGVVEAYAILVLRDAARDHSPLVTSRECCAH